MSRRSTLRPLWVLARDRGGIAAVEFALLTPVFCLLLAGVVDLGGALYAKFKLDSAVTAGANYAQINAASVNSSNGQTLANNIATIVETSQGSGWADDGVVVNNGPSTSVTSGTPTTGGTAANADVCYCPTGAVGTFTWGSSATCGSACPGSGAGYAGKFVTITATKTYTPIFSSYGIVQNDTITATAAVQVQ
jgi:Flp pilus assembly protein TadG